MHNLNYKHLRYFWMVAKAGSIARASEQLHLTPQSISGQLSEFESALGVALFPPRRARLELTETGQRLLGFAEQIFVLGDELLDAIRDEAAPQSMPFRVGIADSVPKMVAYRLVEPSLGLAEPIRLICREGRLTNLLADLAVHRLDMVIADRPMPDNLNVRGYDHFLGESGVTVFGTPALLASAGAATRALPCPARRRTVPTARRRCRAAPTPDALVRIANDCGRASSANLTTAHCSRRSVKRGPASSSRRPLSKLTSLGNTRCRSSAASTRCANRSSPSPRNVNSPIRPSLPSAASPSMMCLAVRSRRSQNNGKSA